MLSRRMIEECGDTNDLAVYPKQITKLIDIRPDSDNCDQFFRRFASRDGFMCPWIDLQTNESIGFGFTQGFLS